MSLNVERLKNDGAAMDMTVVYYSSALQGEKELAPECKLVYCFLHQKMSDELSNVLRVLVDFMFLHKLLILLDQ